MAKSQYILEITEVQRSTAQIKVNQICAGSLVLTSVSLESRVRARANCSWVYFSSNAHVNLQYGAVYHCKRSTEATLDTSIPLWSRDPLFTHLVTFDTSLSGSNVTSKLFQCIFKNFKQCTFSG